MDIRNIAMRGLVKIAQQRKTTYEAVFGRPYKRMATGNLANDAKMQEWDKILGDTRTGDELFDDMMKQPGAASNRGMATGGPANSARMRYNETMKNYNAAAKKRQDALVQRNNQRLAYANRQEPRNYATKTPYVRDRAQQRQMLQSGNSFIGKGKDGNYYKYGRNKNGNGYVRMRVADQNGSPYQGSKLQVFQGGSQWANSQNPAARYNQQAIVQGKPPATAPAQSQPNAQPPAMTQGAAPRPGMA